MNLKKILIGFMTVLVVLTLIGCAGETVETTDNDDNQADVQMATEDDALSSLDTDWVEESDNVEIGEMI